MNAVIRELTEEEFVKIDILLLQGKKIPAIKLYYMELKGAHDLKEAKEVIEARQEDLCEEGLAVVNPPGSYCQVTRKGMVWLTEYGVIPELNPKRHFYLYAKGHYKRSGDLLDDLKHIAAAYCGMAVEQYHDSDLIILLGNEVFKHIKNEHVFVDMLKELHPDSLRSTMFLKGEPYIVRLMSQFLKFFAVAKIRDGDQVIINLGEPDPGILPVEEQNEH